MFLCEVDSDYSNVPQAVAVRSCPHNNVDRDDFLRECRLLASVRHANVASLVGVTTADGPYCAVLEHSLHGDLYNYLRQLSRVTMSTATSTAATSLSSTSTTTSTSSGVSLVSTSAGADRTISYTRILEMSAQMAAGMKYLESRNIVHKDLAAR